MAECERSHQEVFIHRCEDEIVEDVAQDVDDQCLEEVLLVVFLSDVFGIEPFLHDFCHEQAHIGLECIVDLLPDIIVLPCQIRNKGDFVNYLKAFLKGVVKDDTIAYVNEKKGIFDEIEM